MASVGESAASAPGVAPAPSSGQIPGDVQEALEDSSLPSYAIDRLGIIRWLNPAAQELVGDVRGRQMTSVVAPEQVRETRESFTRKVLGTEASTDANVVLIDRDGKRVMVEVNSVPLKEGGRIVGVFGIVPRREPAPPPEPHPRLTPRQNQVLHLLARGFSTMQIADELTITPDTARNHVRRMLRALDTHSRIEAVAVAHREGILRRF